VSLQHKNTLTVHRCIC